MAFYSTLRSHFGGVSGTIIPFTVKLAAGNIPNQGNFRTLLPGGFLRCDGSVLNAAQYPVLAQILGIGDDSKFLRPGEVIGADEFKLPDLGSKYIVGGRSSGGYLNDTITNPDVPAGTYRVGAEVEVDSLVGSSETITYDGYFEIVDQGGFEFIGDPTFNTLTSDGRTLPSFLPNTSFQSHGHEGNVGYFRYLGRWLNSQFVNNEGQPSGINNAGGINGAQDEGSNNLVQISFPDDATFAPGHAHRVEFPGGVSNIRSKNLLKYNFEPEAGQTNVQIDALGLETTVTITTSNIYKLDEVTPPFILVEYLIKI